MMKNKFFAVQQNPHRIAPNHTFVFARQFTLIFAERIALSGRRISGKYIQINAVQTGIVALMIALYAVAVVLNTAVKSR